VLGLSKNYRLRVVGKIVASCEDAIAQAISTAETNEQPKVRLSESAQ
jgi:hypothetical protein